MLAALSLALGLFAPAFVSAATANNFVNPAPLGSRSLADSPTYEAGQVLDVSWATSLTSVDLVLWQAAVDSSSFHIFQGKTSGTSYLWEINVDTFDTSGFNATTGVSNNLFFLVMYLTGSTSPAFESEYFNVTFPASASSSATTTSSLTPTTTYVTPQTVTPTAQSTWICDTDPGNVDCPCVGPCDNSAYYRRLGLGLGLGLGIPLLLAVAGLAWVLGSRKRRRTGDTQQGPTPPSNTTQSGTSGLPQQDSQPAAIIEHYGPAQHMPMQQTPAPASNDPPRQPIVTAKYQ